MRAARRFLLAIVALLLAGAPAAVVAERVAGAPAVREASAAELPREARETLDLIRRGGPYPYERDGTAFGNYERMLPPQPRGYYREYTVRTPGTQGRGARRVVAGRGGELYYTDDHYRTFRRIREP